MTRSKQTNKQTAIIYAIDPIRFVSAVKTPRLNVGVLILEESEVWIFGVNNSSLTKQQMCILLGCGPLPGFQWQIKV